MDKINFSKFLESLKRLSIGWVIFGVVSLILAGVTFAMAKHFVMSWSLTQLPGIVVQEETQTENLPAGEPTPTEEVVAPEDSLPPVWDGASRVTVLFIGLDERDWEAESDAPRSDTMILFTMDPVSKTAGMLSIPRDMWVDIPGFGYGKINTAYALGESYKLPGGGPALAMATVEQFLGVPIQYYIQVNFHAFEEAIDAIGGLEICLDQTMWLDPIGPKPKEKVKQGCHTLPGYLVLAYARDRKSTKGGDVDRALRQQKVIMALRDKVLSPENFPTMIANAPDIYAEAESGLRMNLSFNDILRLAMLAEQIPVENIKRGVIDFDMVIMDTSPDGLFIFKPIPDKIRVLRDEIFTASGALSPQAKGETLDLAREEGARIKVLNGAYGIPQATGLAARTQQYFASQGLNIVGVDNANELRDQTKLVVHAPSLYAMRYFMEEIPNLRVVFRVDAAADSDLDLVVGNDWALNNPMPPQ
jgi:LCP family protein required for cell wall assembly